MKFYHLILSPGNNHIVLYNFQTNATEKYLLDDYGGDYNFIQRIYNTNYIAVVE